jgi:flagellar biosynthesis GTPase FlhF
MPRKKTHEEFVKEIKDKYGNEYEILGKYVNAKNKIKVRHNCNKCSNYEWEVTPDSLLRGTRCPICNGGVKKTHKEFIERIRKKYNGEYEILGKYINAKTKILVRHNCDKCDFHKWNITPSNLLRGYGCPKCAGNIKKTTEEFKQEVYDKYKDEYIVLGEYKNTNSKILIEHNCKECHYHQWEITPSKLLCGRGCPVCGGTKKKTHEEFIQEIKDKYGNDYEVLGEYVSNDKKVLIRHNSDKCNYHEWKTLPNNLLKGHGCPVCGGREAKLGINTIWDTDRWMCNLGVSEEDAKKYSRGSSRKITVTCPDCGRKKKIEPHAILQHKTIFCSCGDGKSYPEKFIMNFLEQLGLEFETEYKPQWIDNKRYDFHIKDNSCIIETHGEQHYKQTSRRGERSRTLEEEQENDKYKREMALKNGIKYYVELDCRESNMEWIKKSIINSELNKLFDLSNIDWTSCEEFANKNIVKEVCDYWNHKREDETTSDLMRRFVLARITIIRYLKKGTELGWCEYNPKEHYKKVEVFKDNKSLGIFSSCAELERQSEKLFGIKLLNQSISDVCNSKKSQYKGFTFKYIIN